MNTQKTAEEIAAEIDQLRARMDSTLGEIEHRLKPSALVREGVTSFSRSDAVRYVLSFAALARKYPIPSTAAGIGVVAISIGLRWYKASKVTEDVASTGRLLRAMDAASGALRDTTKTISEATVSGMEGAKDIVNHAGRSIRHAGSSARSMARERPLAVWATALACTAVALGIPYIRRKF